MTENIHCTHCGEKIPYGADYCIKCARPIKTGKAFCKNCGESLKDEQVFCLKCGKGVEAATTPAPSQSGMPGRKRLTAILLAVLLGGIGAHKFYSGNIGLGVLYLIFCWTFIPCIIGLIEGIIYLTMSDDEFLEKYGDD